MINSSKTLELYGLQNLEHIWFGIQSKVMAFNNLEVITLSKCHNLYVFSPRVAKLLVHLQKLQISCCKKMEEIVVKEDEKDEDILNKIAFTRLGALELQYMPNLRIFYSGNSAIELPFLKDLKLNQCNKMVSFSYGSLHAPMLKRVQLNGSICPLKGDLNATIRAFGC